MSVATVSREDIQAKLGENKARLTLQIARELGVPEARVIETMPADQVTELDSSRWEELIRAFEPLGRVHLIATTRAATLECDGEFGKFSKWGEFFNVQTKTLDMHIRGGQLARIFAVVKPSHMDGVKTLSFQFFDPEGHSAFKVFLSTGVKEPSAEMEAAFEALREKFALNAAVAS